MNEIVSDHIRREAEQDHAGVRADAAERVKIQWSIADATLKALLLANGGAMVALFTFVGNLVARGARTAQFDAGWLWWGFACFVAGLVLGLVCHVAAFVSQDRFYNMSMREVWRHQRIRRSGVFEQPTNDEWRYFGQGKAWYALGVLLSVLSMVLFAAGCGFALQGVLIG